MDIDTNTRNEHRVYLTLRDTSAERRTFKRNKQTGGLVNS